MKRKKTTKKAKKSGSISKLDDLFSEKRSRTPIPAHAAKIKVLLATARAQLFYILSSSGPSGSWDLSVSPKNVSLALTSWKMATYDCLNQYIDIDAYSEISTDEFLKNESLYDFKDIDTNNSYKMAFSQINTHFELGCEKDGALQRSLYEFEMLLMSLLISPPLRPLKKNILKMPEPLIDYRECLAECRKEFSFPIADYFKIKDSGVYFDENFVMVNQYESWLLEKENLSVNINSTNKTVEKNGEIYKLTPDQIAVLQILKWHSEEFPNDTMKEDEILRKLKRLGPKTRISQIFRSRKAAYIDLIEHIRPCSYRLKK